MSYDSNITLYKYRGFSNFEFAIDIFLNQRLYAAHFQQLNDPMEGRFRYNRQNIDRYRIDEVIGQKSDYGILSLSATPYNHLLWSYYAEGHSGFVVGLKIKPDQDLVLEEVEYTENFRLNDDEIDAKNILLKKHAIWAHEKEYRALKRSYDGPFVTVEITELIFGKNTSGKQKPKQDIIRQLAEKLCPGIEISTMNTNDIKKGLLEF